MISLPALKHYASVIMGQSPPSDTYNVDGEGLPFLQGNAEFGAVSPSAKYFCPVAPKTAESGDVLLSVRAPVGALNFADQRYGIGRGLCAVRAAKNKAAPKFLYYLLWHLRAELSSVATGSTYDAVSSEDVAALRFHFPSVRTQKAIADYLDEKTAAIDALIEKKRKLLDLLAEERAALINQAVTKGLDPTVPMKDSGIPWIGEIPAHWETRQLGHCLQRITYGFTCPMPTTDEGPYMLTANDIQDGRIAYESARHTDGKAMAELTEKCTPRPGDILLTKDGTLGRVAIADNATCCINQSVALLRVNPSRISSEFLSWMLRSRSYQDWMTFDAGGTTIKHIYITRVTKMAALLPPPDEQELIVTHARGLDEKFVPAFQTVQGQLDRLQEYRQALITAAVTGQLDIEAAA